MIYTPIESAGVPLYGNNIRQMEEMLKWVMTHGRSVKTNLNGVIVKMHMEPEDRL